MLQQIVIKRGFKNQIKPHKIHPKVELILRHIQWCIKLRGQFLECIGIKQFWTKWKTSKTYKMRTQVKEDKSNSSEIQNGIEYFWTDNKLF